MQSPQIAGFSGVVLEAALEALRHLIPNLHSGLRALPGAVLVVTREQ